MSDKYSEIFGKRKEDGDSEFNNIMTPEELESFEIISCSEDISSVDDLQIFEGENNETKNVYDNLNDYLDISETQYFEQEGNDEEYFQEDVWDDFEMAKPYMEKFDSKNAVKMTKKKSKLQKRNKAMIRYKNTTPTIGFDEQTKFLLQRLVGRRYMSRYYHIIGTGSNSVLLYGNSSTCYSWRLPWEVVVKVYENNEAAYKRAQNEFKSLDHLKRCKINGPTPVCAWRNIIVMGAIGYGKTAQSITTAPFELDLKHYLHIIDSIKRMYQIAKVVHGNLSHRSIMWYGQPYFISLSHSVPTDHPDALKLLIKDCFNVTHLFKCRGLSELKTTEELFKFVTDLPDVDDTLLKILESMKPSDTSEPISYNSKFSTGKPPANYASILEFCTKISR